MAQNFLAWGEEYAVGHQELDAEHRQLVQAINAICSAEQAQASPEKLAPLLKALVLGAVEHFKHENQVMRDFSVIAMQSHPNAADFLETLSAAAINEHCSEHARALVALELIIHNYAAGTKPAQGSVGTTIIGWFIAHSTEHDAGLRNVFQTLKP
jgi:hemerythrin